MCCCQRWNKYKKAVLNPQSPHWVLSGSLLGDTVPPDLNVLAEVSLQNNAFNLFSEASNDGVKTMDCHPFENANASSWDKTFGLPTPPISQITPLPKLHPTVESHFQGAVFHCEDKHASFLRIFCPCLYHRAITNTFLDPAVFTTVDQHPDEMVCALVSD